MNRHMRDKFVGKEVLIIKGEWKGFRGRVKRADDKQAIVEISSKCKQIPIDKEWIILPPNDQDKATTRDDNTAGGRTVYEAGKTPMPYNTPSYYPQSSAWGAVGNTDCKTLNILYYFLDDFNNGGMSPGNNNVSRPGSEH